MRGNLNRTHLQRKAVVYVRQSTAAQVFEHQESTKRQYALADRAAALGWDKGSIEVIDDDQGVSGSSVDGRTGFLRLAKSVSLGEVGAILAVEVSRLARSSEDWQRLLALCAVARAVVIDEQAIYDPSDHDDRLLLDLKGTMSEAELHWLGLRLAGAKRSKAARGELHIPVPTGYVWLESKMAMDADEAVRAAIQLVLRRFEVEPSAWAVVRWANRTGFLLPTRHVHADGPGEVKWQPLSEARLIDMLHNPTYAGVYAFGRRPEFKVLRGGSSCRVRDGGLDPTKWAVRIEEAHPAYLTWEQFLTNQQKLRGNHVREPKAGSGAPREGAALLNGLVLCGRCGRRMVVAYGRARRCWYYMCSGERDTRQAACWVVPGNALDEAVERLFLDTMIPTEIELSLAVEREVQGQSDELSRQWHTRLEQAQYEARRAERRYKAVDAENRVVARTLEGEWEQRLRDAAEVERRYREARQHKQVDLTEEDRIRIRALASDLPRVWRAKTTPISDRKAMLRMVIEAISLAPVDLPRRVTRVRVQWKSGQVSELEVDRPTRREARATPVEAIRRVMQLSTEGTRDQEIAERLNTEGYRTGVGRAWDVGAVRWARDRNEDLRVTQDPPRAREPRLPDRHPDGRYSILGAARLLGVSKSCIRIWLKAGRLKGTQEDYQQRQDVWWITIDPTTAQTMGRASRRTS